MAHERLSREERRNTILDAATVVFGSKGFEATRMEDVARAARIAKGLVYKHFPSKDALFEALVDRQGRAYAAELRGVLQSADAAANPVEATRRGLALWLRQVSGDPATFQLADPGSHSAYDQLRERMRAVIAEAIHAAAPGVDPQAELLVAAAVQGAAEAVATAWAKSSSGVSEAEALDVLTSFCWGGLSLLMDRFAPAAPPAVSSG
ncbi:MAG TPA: helix-turn-helix domain-containing protein [Acidimicrobiales bacterium]|nr:helix-turn-helix domain-containing protein [Acidimicrobiales bacterium]